MGNRDELWKAIMGVSIRTFVNFLLVLVIIEGFIYSYHFSYKLFADVAYKPATSESIVVAIPEGSNARSVASIMEDSGVVENKYMMLARLYLGRYNTRIMAGSYTLTPSMTPDEICRLICGIQNEEKL